MAKDLDDFGISTMLAVGAAAMGHPIISVEPVALDASGGLVNAAPGASGVRIRYVQEDGRASCHTMSRASRKSTRLSLPVFTTSFRATMDMNKVWVRGDLCLLYTNAPRDPFVRWMGCVPFRFGYGPCNSPHLSLELQAKVSNIIYRIAR